MPATKYGINEVHQWRDKAWRLRLKRRLSINEICRQIGEEFGVHPQAVKYRVFGLGRANHDRKYGKGYDLRYKHLIRHLDAVLPTLYNGNSELSLTEITTRIETHKGISMRENTLEKLLGKYEGKERGSPVVKTGSGKYQLNQSFYRV